MNQLLDARRNLRRRINLIPKCDWYLRTFASLVLLLNVILVLYVLLSVTTNMTSSGLGLIDSLPIVLYIFPLAILLPWMTVMYYRERTALWGFIFLMISTFLFTILANLIRGFVICLVFNIIAAVVLFFTGRFRPKVSLKHIKKKSIASFLLLNILGLTFPVSIFIMGQTPIAITPVNQIPQIALSVPLSAFDYPYQNVTPNAELLSNISSNEFILDFRILENDTQSWIRLRNWLVSINNTGIQYTLTLTSPRANFTRDSSNLLASTDVIVDIYRSHRSAYSYLRNVSLLNIINSPSKVIFDMTLSRMEWQTVMNEIRSLNIYGFGGLLRSSLYAVSLETIEQEAMLLSTEILSSGIDAGVLVEPFVVDDIIDGDTLTMKLCGVSVSTIGLWDSISVLCERSRFSFEMGGDVGEYLVHSYSSSVANRGGSWSLRLGNVGNLMDVSGRLDSVYGTFDVLINDIALAAGNGVEFIIIDALPSILEEFGVESLSILRNAIVSMEEGEATYTFRIYAFRAVFMAIDAFDFLML